LHGVGYGQLKKSYETVSMSYPPPPKAMLLYMYMCRAKKNTISIKRLIAQLTRGTGSYSQVTEPTVQTTV